MDRFTETPFPAARFDRDEDGFPVPAAVELPMCESCGHAAAELVPCVWDAALLVGACCAVPEEPKCECTQTDVDLFDARGCELHDSRSRYNQALTMAERYERFNKSEVA